MFDTPGFGANFEFVKHSSLLVCRRRPPCRSRRGQGVLEFTLVFIVFLMVLGAIIEVSRGMNALVTLNSIAYTVASRAAIDDPLLSIRTPEVQGFIDDEFDRHTHVGRFYFMDPTLLTSQIDLNHTEIVPGSGDHIYFTKIHLDYAMSPVFLPDVRWTVGVTAHRLNQLQGYRPP
jgi:hypothetical protein